MTEIIPLDDWAFDVDEISAGVYRARGVRSTDNRVECVSTDPDKALADCGEKACELEREILQASKKRNERS